MALILKGKPVADEIKASLHPKSVALATIRVGDNAADVAYERSLTKAARSIGIEVASKAFEAQATTSEVLAEIDRLNADVKVSAIMLFRPLPSHLDETLICNSINPKKDVDGVGATSLAGVFTGMREGFVPATAQACMAILDHYDIPIEGKHVAIIGRSLVVGKPVGMLLLDRNATVTYCHSRTSGLSDITRCADIVVCAVGRPRFFGSEYFREGQTVIDVGINDDGSGGLCGDVDFETVEPIVGAITPVPGGVGSVSTSILLSHVVEASGC